MKQSSPYIAPVRTYRGYQQPAYGMPPVQPGYGAGYPTR